MYSKRELELNPSRVKLYQLIASLFVILPHFNPTKLKLEFLKFDFKCKNKQINVFTSLKFDLFQVQLEFTFRIQHSVKNKPTSSLVVSQDT